MLTAEEILKRIDESLKNDGGNAYRRYLKVAINQLEDAFNDNVEKNYQRNYLGASGLGHYCALKIWLDFKNVLIENQKNNNPKFIRLLNRGHLEEARFFALLRSAGFHVMPEPNADNSPTEQFKVKKGFLKGHLDGVLVEEDSDYLLEFKTANENNFKKFQDLGVMQANYTYYVQMQIYLKFWKLPKAIFMAVNKNTDELYCEIVEYDEAIATAYADYAQRVIYSKVAPPQNKNFECKFCDYYAYCYKNDSSKLNFNNCRMCINCVVAGSEKKPTDKMNCIAHNFEINENTQVCDKFQLQQ